MSAGGDALEDFATARAERDLRSLLDRAPATANRYADGRDRGRAGRRRRIGDRLLVRAGEVVPVDGVVTADARCSTNRR